MFQRMVASALIAGIAAGLIAALLHFAFVQKFILLGEQFETGALVHFGSSGTKAAEHDHDAAEPEPADPEEPAAHDHGAGHDHAATGETSDLKRNALTVTFMVILYVAYAFLLIAGFGLAEAMGKTIGAAEGMLWGIAGFVAFQLAPAMGLPPELPGTIAAELTARQVWWWATVACTGGGIAMLAYGRHWAAFGLAGALLALPHAIGAPEGPGYFGVAPPEVGAAFAARVLGTALVVWAVMGWFAAVAWHHEGRRAQ